MPEKWTGDLVGKMHIHRVTMADLGRELGITRAYVSMILAGQRGKRGNVDNEKRMNEALDRILARRAEAEA
jgi:predicted transcriptional regulator